MSPPPASVPPSNVVEAPRFAAPDFEGVVTHAALEVDVVVHATIVLGQQIVAISAKEGEAVICIHIDAALVARDCVTINDNSEAVIGLSSSTIDQDIRHGSDVYRPGR